MEIDQLLTIFRVAVVLAGFAGLIAAYGYKDRATKADVIGIALIVTVSLGIAITAIIPVVLLNFRLGKPLIWVLEVGSAPAGLSVSAIMCSNISRGSRSEAAYLNGSVIACFS